VGGSFGSVGGQVGGSFGPTGGQAGGSFGSMGGGQTGGSSKSTSGGQTGGGTGSVTFGPGISSTNKQIGSVSMGQAGGGIGSVTFGPGISSTDKPIGSVSMGQTGGYMGAVSFNSPTASARFFAVPPGVNVPFNMEIAARLRDTIGGYEVFRELVKTGGPWDYKNQPTAGAHPEYDQFGNFNFGATGTAMGLSPYVLDVGAGLAQPPHSGGSGTPFITPPYGDRAQDERMIHQGDAYAHSQGW